MENLRDSVAYKLEAVNKVEGNKILTRLFKAQFNSSFEFIREAIKWDMIKDSAMELLLSLAEDSDKAIKEHLIIKQLIDMDGADLAEVHNTYCMIIKDYDSKIYYNDEDNIIMLVGDCPYNALQRAFYGDYNPNHDYVKLDGYANLKSFDDPTEHISKSDMLDTIMDNLEEFEDLFDLEY